ncbi:MAG TPA: PEP-CTERM sorting domain-containing protein [Clostridia bacterium]|nr:PEP-CTERM sorting domain-containing protein [Clostridia bacterium]
MQRQYAISLAALVLLAAFIGGTRRADAQGAITFDAHPLFVGTDYSEAGMAFRVIPSGSSYDNLGILPPNWANNVPQNSTPFMNFFRENSPLEYVELSLMNGALFGLTSMQLADPRSPSLSPLTISFIGHLFGGGTVVNTFTTPGGGATTFATYTFNSAFASGLTSVDILAPRWAMDNLAFTVIPEPGTLALLGLGALGWLLQFKRGRANRPE